MRLLLDQGLPRSTVHHLDAPGVESAHVGEKGLATASDAKIIDFARQGGWIVVTLDADFHALLALSGVRIRIEGLRAGGLFLDVHPWLARCAVKAIRASPVL
jgi:predicted nuclease of predicted toxin-antitoxin system